MSTAVGAFARVERPRLLQRANPLAVATAVAPGIVVALTARTPAIPLALLLLATAAVGFGVRIPARYRLLVLAGPALFALVASLTLGLWTPSGHTADSPLLFQVGAFEYRVATWLAGLEISLRLGAVFALALVPGVASTGPDVVRAAVQHLRVPYRVGYTALASFRFVPRFSRELAQIRAAHRVRGTVGGRGPVAVVRRSAGYLVPLLAGALRHAERVALAMDARAFGANTTRTERTSLPLRWTDGLLVFLAWTCIGITLQIPV